MKKYGMLKWQVSKILKMLIIKESPFIYLFIYLFRGFNQYPVTELHLAASDDTSNKVLLR